MKHFLFFILFAFITMSAICMLFIAVWVYSVYYRVKRSPRSTMFVCPRHGMFLPKDCIKFVGTDYCPMCFHSNIKRAEELGIQQYMNNNYQNNDEWRKNLEEEKTPEGYPRPVRRGPRGFVQ